MIEKCDNVQGIWMVVDTNTGWGTYALEFLKEIWEEMGKTPILLYSVTGKEPEIDLYDPDLTS